MTVLSHEAPRVVFRTDASPRIGGGHVMRCLALADALAARGASAGFVCALLPPALRDRLLQAGHRVWSIEPTDELLDLTGSWDTSVLSEHAQRVDAASTSHAVQAERPHWVVVDHYRLSSSWADVLRSGESRVLVIDDLANRPHACDLLVDQTLGRRSDAYSSLVPADCALLLGARYALLRPEFAQARPAALGRRRTGGEVERLLVSLGTGDIGGVTADVVDALVDRQLPCDIDVVLSRDAASLPRVQALARQRDDVTLHVETARMAELTARADLAVGAAGVSSWERCCLGLPAVTLVLADNQRLVADALGRTGATVVVPGAREAAAAVVRLMDDQTERSRMVAAAAAVTDGTGAAAVADAMLVALQPEASPVPHEAVVLRAATAADSEPVWVWRNDPLMREMAKSAAPITWADHDTWFAQTLRTTTSRMYVAEVDGRPAAVVRFDAADGAATVSINVDPGRRGRGVGRRALVLACDRYASDVGPVALVAEVRKSNAASRSIFTAAGFREDATDQGPFLRYVRPGAALSQGHPGGHE